MIDSSHSPADSTPRPERRLRVMGAVLAGGRSTRFGSPKALAPLGNTPMVRLVADAVSATLTHPVLVSSMEELAAVVPWPRRPDAIAGIGPLGGVLTALTWARELGLPGALCVACDLPFLRPSVLRFIIQSGLSGNAAAIVPQSSASRGVEPLCAWYSVSALPAVERAVAGPQHSLRALLLELGARRIARARLVEFGDPDVMFLNVNTPAAHLLARRIASGMVSG